jgi:adenylate cyclase
MAAQTPTHIDATAIREEVARILSDAAFVRSPRMQRFLSFVVEEALAERADQLAEYGIGLEVFDRGADFEPGLDPIVRNDARRLRQKLMEYYRRKEREGGTGVLIEIPKGGYAPSFLAMTSRAHVNGSGDSVVRLAVLLFENLSLAPEAALLCRALRRSLSAGLTNLPGIETISHEFLQSGALRSAGEELGLSYVVEGSVQTDGRSCRAIVALVRVRDGAQKWARGYEFGCGEMLAVQRDPAAGIACDIAGFLGLATPHRAFASLAA